MLFFACEAYEIFFRIQFSDSLQEVIRQFHLTAEDRARSGLLQIRKGRVKSQDSRDVRGSRLETVRKKTGNLFRVGNASCTAADKRFRLRGKLISDKKTACTLGSPKAFVAGESQGVNMHGFHVDGENPGGLRGIQNKNKAVLPAEFPDFLRHALSQSDVGRVKADQKPGFRTEKILCFLEEKRSVGTAGDPVEGYACM